ncbi:hypothetical protein C1631_006480 [Chryseobacterium phosphatilyticum]|uniref:Lipoprotein n=1 Tax=Chryseobacterium phosphatilyticum TaxID=475075 RepID=A0A316XEJ7_9FLAO|nr:hypothetical protein [Chryseobacterium phosphatilyticum]PWN72241.1 hypothetical protein C1631_006480 [Chryseobacterium phosphatilyticum]
MKKLLILLGFSFLLISCVQQKQLVNSLSCQNKITVQYDNSKAKGVMAKNKELVIVFFMNDFNDKIKGYINGKQKFNGEVLTKETSGKSDKNFAYNYSKDKTLPILKIEKENGSCFDIRIKKRYKLVYVFYDSNQEWIVRFSNKYYVDN